VAYFVGSVCGWRVITVINTQQVANSVLKMLSVYVSRQYVDSLVLLQLRTYEQPPCVCSPYYNGDTDVTRRLITQSNVRW